MTVRQFSLVGAGRAGRSITLALEDIGWVLARTYQRGDSVVNAGVDVELCVIATPDVAIEQVSAMIEPSDAVVLHLSGVTPLGVLAKHERRAALHPLVALADPDLGRHALRSCWFGVAGHQVAQELADALSGRSFTIADSDRAIYHAAATIASNHSVALFGQVERLAEHLGVPGEAFLDLAQVSLENSREVGAAAALTGPAARGDEETIAIHRDALAQRFPDELATYDVLLAEARRLAAHSDRED